MPYRINSIQQPILYQGDIMMRLTYELYFIFSHNMPISYA